MLRFFLMIIAAVGLAASATAAKSPLELNWLDLVPKLPPLVDPLEAIGPEQRIELESVLWVRQLSDADRKEYPEAVEEAETYEREFAKRGFSVDKLIDDYARWSLEQTKRQALVRKSLNGKMIRMKGYLLPIAFSEDGVRDFLLVPYVGACIHVPAPPPNQIVYVRLKEKLIITDLFTAVDITGKLSTKASLRNLALSDGEADVPVGYQLTATNYTVIPETY
ncbi:MAG: DUF3299 domain-containing protein [Pseudomonadota bacterium]